jgi:hypothetical protein
MTDRQRGRRVGMSGAMMRSRLKNLAAFRQRQAEEAFDRASELYEWDPLDQEGFEQARREAKSAE